VRLSEEMIKRLDAVTGFDPGFPRNFIERSGSFVYGAVGNKVVPRGDDTTE
jgi:hypothetical protein